MELTHIRNAFKLHQGTSATRINDAALPHWREREGAPKELAPAAVLVPLVSGDSGIDVLLTQRATHLKKHPGQVSFPGGRYEETDQSLEATAIRETVEETGIDSELIDVLGHLPRMITSSFFDVDPVVAWVKPGFSLRADASEVQAIFTVPLAYLADERNRIDRDMTFYGTDLKMMEWHYADQRIWGVTAAIIFALLHKLSVNTG